MTPDAMGIQSTTAFRTAGFSRISSFKPSQYLNASRTLKTKLGIRSSALLDNDLTFFDLLLPRDIDDVLPMSDRTKSKIERDQGSRFGTNEKLGAAAT